MTTLADILVQQGVLPHSHVNYMAMMAKKEDITLAQKLVAENMVNAQQLAQTLAQALQLPLITQAGLTLNPSLTELVPAYLCQEHRVLPMSQQPDGTVLLAMTDPTDADAIQSVQQETQLRFTFAVIDEDTIQIAWNHMGIGGDAGGFGAMPMTFAGGNIAERGVYADLSSGEGMPLVSGKEVSPSQVGAPVHAPAGPPMPGAAPPVAPPGPPLPSSSPFAPGNVPTTNGYLGEDPAKIHGGALNTPTPTGSMTQDDAAWLNNRGANFQKTPSGAAPPPPVQLEVTPLPMSAVTPAPAAPAPAADPALSLFDQMLAESGGPAAPPPTGPPPPTAEVVEPDLATTAMPMVKVADDATQLAVGLDPDISFADDDDDDEVDFIADDDALDDEVDFLLGGEDGEDAEVAFADDDDDEVVFDPDDLDDDDDDDLLAAFDDDDESDMGATPAVDDVSVQSPQAAPDGDDLLAALEGADVEEFDTHTPPSGTPAMSALASLDDRDALDFAAAMLDDDDDDDEDDDDELDFDALELMASKASPESSAVSAPPPATAPVEAGFGDDDDDEGFDDLLDDLTASPTPLPTAAPAPSSEEASVTMAKAMPQPEMAPSDPLAPQATLQVSPLDDVPPTAVLGDVPPTAVIEDVASPLESLATTDAPAKRGPWDLPPSSSPLGDFADDEGGFSEEITGEFGDKPIAPAASEPPGAFAAEPQTVVDFSAAPADAPLGPPAKNSEEGAFFEDVPTQALSASQIAMHTSFSDDNEPSAVDVSGFDVSGFDDEVPTQATDKQAIAAEMAKVKEQALQAQQAGLSGPPVASGDADAFDAPTMAVDTSTMRLDGLVAPPPAPVGPPVGPPVGDDFGADAATLAVDASTLGLNLGAAPSAPPAGGAPPVAPAGTAPDDDAPTRMVNVAELSLSDLAPSTEAFDEDATGTIEVNVSPGSVNLRGDTAEHAAVKATVESPVGPPIGPSVTGPPVPTFTDAPGTLLDDGPTRAVNVNELNLSGLLPGQTPPVDDDDDAPTRAISAAELGLSLDASRSEPTAEERRPTSRPRFPSPSDLQSPKSSGFEDVPTRALSAKEIAHQLSQESPVGPPVPSADEAGFFENLSTQAVEPEEMERLHASQNIRLRDGDDDT